MLLLTLVLMLTLILVLMLIVLGSVTELHSVRCRRRHCRDALKRRRGSRTDHRRRSRAAERFEAAAVIAAATPIPIRIRISKRIIVDSRHEQVQLVVKELGSTGCAAAAAMRRVVGRVDRETAAAVSTAVMRHAIQRATNRVDADLRCVCLTHSEGS